MSPAREAHRARRASPAAPMPGSAYRSAAGHGYGQVPATGTSILSIGRATPALRVTQEQNLEYAGYSTDSKRAPRLPKVHIWEIASGPQRYLE